VATLLLGPHLRPADRTAVAGRLDQGRTRVRHHGLAAPRTARLQGCLKLTQLTARSRLRRFGCSASVVKNVGHGLVNSRKTVDTVRGASAREAVHADVISPALPRHARQATGLGS